MASATDTPSIVRFTNCVLAFDGTEQPDDLYICQAAGKIVPKPSPSEPVRTVDLGGRLLSPGLIDVQLNGAMGLNFSDVPATEPEMAGYAEAVDRTFTGLIKTGVTSLLPTLVTAKSEVFKRAIPYVAPKGHLRDASAGAESLGIHCEGPFISPAKKGAHAADLLQIPSAGAKTIEEFYGLENLKPPSVGEADAQNSRPAPIRKITVAPELPGMYDAIRDLTRDYGTVISLGHSGATYEQGLEGIRAGATMLTHTFNAMEPFLHRKPGLVGLIGAPETELKKMDGKLSRPFFGLITDDIHVHPSCVRAAWAMHEEGCIVTTDGTAATGLDLPDGVHQWKTGGRRVIKSGRKLFLEGTDTIAGGTTTLLQCVSNLIRWTGVSPARALKTVTGNPAKMLGLEDVKGTLRPGADADLLVLSWDGANGQQELKVDEVWKFGTQVFVAADAQS
ncbi:Glucosamine-6-phosphate isomerase [Pleurostoma richardsiae]|uniref:N-acetylglucosamine-6-phosphate deacetylase n=1 Tax=Pleurostoma richardsiae TaxID=41990 RepID=A0AA38RIV6_9PEZI|nr:Glucosamine-6-phosphate isomerase [Pleurostoma richardsiae]